MACRVSSDFTEKGAEDLDQVVQLELRRSPKEALQLSKDMAKEMDFMGNTVVRLMKEIQQLQDVCPLPLHCQAVLERGQIQPHDVHVESLKHLSFNIDLKICLIKDLFHLTKELFNSFISFICSIFR